jgi:hypothetical protein
VPVFLGDHELPKEGVIVVVMLDLLKKAICHES